MGRPRPPEPRFDGEPVPPGWLTEDGTDERHKKFLAACREKWDEMLDILHRVPGLSQQPDGEALARYAAEAVRHAELMRFRARTDAVVSDGEGGWAPNPFERQLAQASERMLVLEREFGFTPQSRTRLAVSPGGNTKAKKEDAMFGGDDIPMYGATAVQ